MRGDLPVRCPPPIYIFSAWDTQFSVFQVRAMTIEAYSSREVAVPCERHMYGIKAAAQAKVFCPMYNTVHVILSSIYIA